MLWILLIFLKLAVSDTMGQYQVRDSKHRSTEIITKTTGLIFNWSHILCNSHHKNIEITSNYSLDQQEQEEQLNITKSEMGISFLVKENKRERKVPTKWKYNNIIYYLSLQFITYYNILKLWRHTLPRTAGRAGGVCSFSRSPFL